MSITNNHRRFQRNKEKFIGLSRFKRSAFRTIIELDNAPSSDGNDSAIDDERIISSRRF